MTVDVKEVKTSLQREQDSLQGIAEELRLKATLARADIKDELGRLEVKLRRAHEDISRLGEHMKAPLHELESAIRKLLAEVRIGFENIRKAFDNPN